MQVFSVHALRLQVKSGAENMIAMYGGVGAGAGAALPPANKKLLQEAQQMLSDSKIKIEIIRNQLLRLQQTSDTTLDHLGAPGCAALLCADLPALV